MILATWPLHFAFYVIHPQAGHLMFPSRHYTSLASSAPKPLPLPTTRSRHRPPTANIARRRRRRKRKNRIMMVIMLRRRRRKKRRKKGKISNKKTTKTTGKAPEESTRSAPHLNADTGNLRWVASVTS